MGARGMGFRTSANGAAALRAVVVGLAAGAMAPRAALAVTEQDLPASGAGPYVGPTSSSAATTQAPSFARTPARSGPYALIEWNPADLLSSRVRLQGEYVIVDGFAFGGMAEYQKQDESDYRHATTAAGITVVQYFESQTLKGPFIRGELAGMGAVFERKDVEVRQEQAVYGMSMGADLGYRFLLSNRFTGAASYGVRRTVPDFFTTQGDSPVEDWKHHNKVWTMRVQATLGVTL